MRRVRHLPIETVVAISLLALALLTGAGVVVNAAVRPDGDRSLASSGGELPDPPATTAPTTTTVERAPTPTTTPGDEPGADRSSPTTTGPGPSTTVPLAGQRPPPECTSLASETFWARTGDRTPLEAAAGAAGDYVEVVTNRADEPCRLVTSRCDAAPTLLAGDGTPVEQPPRECGSSLTEVVLQPGEQRREELTVAFPVPPGQYQVEVRRYDGTTAALPVLLDDRLPACDPSSLSVAVPEGDLFRRLEDVVAGGLDVGLVLSGAEATCTLRVVESRITLTSGEAEVEIVDTTERWSAVEPGDEVRTHALADPGELEPGDHEGVVTLVLADGAELPAPFRLLLS